VVGKTAPYDRKNYKITIMLLSFFFFSPSILSLAKQERLTPLEFSIKNRARVQIYKLNRQKRKSRKLTKIPFIFLSFLIQSFIRNPLLPDLEQPTHLTSCCQPVRLCASTAAPLPCLGQIRL